MVVQSFSQPTDQELNRFGLIAAFVNRMGCPAKREARAKSLAVQDARIGAVCPGAVRTPINMEAWGTPEAYRDLMKLIPYKRIGEPDDIGRAAVWLASDDSDYIHGASIFVDGGMTLYPGFETGG